MVAKAQKMGWVLSRWSLVGEGGLVGARWWGSVGLAASWWAGLSLSLSLSLCVGRVSPK